MEQIDKIEECKRQLEENKREFEKAKQGFEENKKNIFDIDIELKILEERVMKMERRDLFKEFKEYMYYLEYEEEIEFKTIVEIALLNI